MSEEEIRLMNKEEICTTYHYGILFKVLALIPKILKSCPIPYVVGGGTAIVKYLNDRGIKPEITDKWDSYDWDVYTNDIGAMKDYIIQKLTKELEKKTIRDESQVVPEPPVINVTRMKAQDVPGYQLSLDICYRIKIPSSFRPDEDNDRESVTHKLQFMDIFKENVLPANEINFRSGANYLNVKGYLDRIVIDDVHYYTPIKMLTKLNQAILERSERKAIREQDNIVFRDYTGKTQEVLRSLERLKLRFNRRLRLFVDNLKRVDRSLLRQRPDTDQTTKIILVVAKLADKYEKQLDDVAEALNEYYEKVLLPHFSYRNVAQYIKMDLEVNEELVKLNKMRLRANLLRMAFLLPSQSR